MARTKKETVELTPEEIAKKEQEKKEKQEQKEQLLNNCILNSFNIFSDKELKEFLKLSKDLKCTQEDLLYLSITALLTDKIDFETETKTTLVLK